MEALQVQILNTDDSLEIYRIWTILDTFPEMGEISIYQEFYTCQTLWLKLDAFSLPEYTYYKLSDSTYLDYTIPNTRNSEWTASEDVDIFTDNLLYEQSGYFVGKIGNVATVPGGAEYEGPYKDSDYYLTVTNSFGNSRSDTIFEVVAKAVKADFTVNKIDETGNEEEYSEGNINEALLQVGFENKSENEQSYHWIGYNDSLNILRGGREILWENFQETPSIDSVPQYPPGKYPVKLIVDNEFGCVDSMTFYHVKVDSSSIDSAMIPNVFTPNGDDRNDIFVMPKKDNITGDGARGLVSMKTIEVTILNRSGQLVYKYDGNPNNWNGWDGKVRNGNRDAEEGIYLYVIRGTGYDGVVHESKNYTGFLYLFR
jgi:gliding motility-associated-like protein